MRFAHAYSCYGIFLDKLGPKKRFSGKLGTHYYDKLRWRPFVSSILVEGCVFRDSLGYFADIRCGERFTFRNNRIEDTGRRADRRENSGSARLETVHGVLFENNVFIRPAARTSPTVDIAPDAKNVILRGNRVATATTDQRKGK